MKSWHLHQFWFNFFGSIAGWFLILVFLFILNNISLEDLSIYHISIFVIGILGIVGLFPSLLAQIPNIFQILTKKFTEDFYKKIDKNQ